MKKLLKWLDGKKTTIGAAALIVLKIVMFAGVKIPADLYHILDLIFYFWTGIGLTDKARKALKKSK